MHATSIHRQKFEPKQERAAGKVDGQADYFSFEDTERVYLPDGISYVQIKVLNEGERRHYLNAVNSEVRLDNKTGDAVMEMAIGDERTALLQASVIGWNLIRNDAPVPFSRRTLEEFLCKTHPRIVDLIERSVRRLNPWLMQDITIEDIDEHIRELEALRVQKLRERQELAR